MIIEHYHYVYSAMTQAMGALIALVGIFIVYKLQIQKEKIDIVKEIVRTLMPSGHYLGPHVTLNQIIDRGNIAIKELDEEDQNKSTFKREFNSLTRHVQVFHNTVRHGSIGIIFGAVLFSYYIIGLHCNKWLFYSIYKPSFLIYGFFISIGIIAYLVYFIISCITEEREEYLRKQNKGAV